MNNTKLSNHVRLIAFFLTAVILVCSFGFTVDGWTLGNDASFISPEDIFGGVADNNVNKDSITNKNDDAGENLHKYFNLLTGMDTTEERANSSPLAFVVDAEDACYGISNSDLLIEIPIENNATRFVSFVSDNDGVWKIGSLTSSRDYINDLVKYFGSIAIYNQKDDLKEYVHCDMNNKCLDVSLNAGYHYTEQSDKIYTNCELVISGILSSGMSPEIHSDLKLPYNFNDYGAESIQFNNIGKDVKITRDKNAIIQFKYDSQSKKYLYQKNGEYIIDSLNGKTLNFTNCFILSIDSITYDDAKGCQTVFDTIGNGVGYYLTEGTYTEIQWVASKEGAMTFFLLDGTKVSANRGTGYICYVKSSNMGSVIFT